MLPVTPFYAATLRAIHEAAQAHPTAQQHLTGSSFRLDGQDADGGLVVELPFGQLDSREFAHLFSVFDGSRVHVQREVPGNTAPEGIYGTVINAPLAPFKNKTGVIVGEQGPEGLHMHFLHLDQFFLADKAAPRLGTVAFVLCAITAHRCGLRFIQLVAAGGSGYDPKHVGYMIWPKFGFDAPLLPHEAQQFAGAATVLDVVQQDPNWWEANGSQRLMSFDLAPDSRSWAKLLSYLQGTGLLTP